MALSIRTTFSSTDNGDNTWTTAALSVDDIIFVVQQTAFRASSDLVTPTGTTGVTAWSSFVSLTSEGTVMMRGWWSRVTTSGTKTITFAPAGSFNTNSMTGIVFAGADITSPIDGAVSTATSTNLSAMAIPSVDPVTTNATLVAVWGAYGGGGALGTLTPPATMTEREETNLSTSNANILATQLLTTGNPTGTRTATDSGSSEHAAGIMWAVKAATTVTPPGGTIGVDVISPNRATATSSTSVTTASFTPPAGSVLLVCTSGAGNSNTNPTVAITDSGGAATGAWTQIGLANRTITSSSSYGFAAMHWAAVVSSATFTVTATQTNGSAPTSIKVYVLTGANVSNPVGATPRIGSSTASNLNTTSITTTVNNSYLFCAATEWSAGGTVSSSNLEYSSFSVTGSPSLDGLSGYVATPVVNTAQTCNLQTTDTSAQWTFVAAEIIPAGSKIEIVGIVSAQAFGDFTSVVFPPGPRNITLTGIPSPGALGSFIVSAGTYQPITLDGIGSEEIFGATLIQPDVFVSPRVVAVRPTPTYDLVCVARVPASSGAPTFLEVDPIDWSGLSYTDELSRPQQLNAGCKVSKLTESVLQRLRSPHDNPTEIWLYRNGRRIFSGPLWAFQVQGESLTLNAQSALSYLKGMYVMDDTVYANVDQFAIVTGLIDAWQNSEFGHFGIDTTGIPGSGVLRDATYLAKEEHNVFQRVIELGARQNGFDISIDPASRKLKLSYPQQGVDRSFGEDAIVFDSRNVTSPNIVCSVAPGDLASEAIGTGTSATAGTIYSVKSNLELRGKFGRVGLAANFDGVSEQTTLDAHTQGLIDARDEALLVPGPDVRGTTDADVSAYDVGDLVSYELHQQLRLTGAFRLRKRTVSVSKTGTEAISLQFV